MRRVVLTRDIIAFARVGDQTLVDAIPMAEIMGIEAMYEIGQHQVDAGELLYQNAFQIRTETEGYNSVLQYPFFAKMSFNLLFSQHAGTKILSQSIHATALQRTHQRTLAIS